MPATYTNPVYPDYFADPFVMCYEGTYYAYGTAPGSPDGRQFPVLHSTDLVNWTHAGWVLIPRAGNDFWAPEVAFANGSFYLYYSAFVAGAPHHQLRVAQSSSPLGPFQDVNELLVPGEPFTIDAHPYQDVDGTWYLFYSKDFLTLDEDHRVGTGIVVDKLINMTTLAGSPSLVVRPYLDWQLYTAQRPMHGKVFDWHTVEGAALLRVDGKYYCFYSGGAWERDNYGVSYVVADHPLGPYSRPEAGSPPILRSVPDHVIGPGHNSFITSPDGSQQYIVYHAWDVARTARRMCIDRFVWKDGQPVVEGPTWTPQPVPA